MGGEYEINGFLGKISAAILREIGKEEDKLADRIRGEISVRF